MLLPVIPRHAVEAIAAIAQTDAEMGGSDDAVRQLVMDLFERVGLSSRADMLAIADHIVTGPLDPALSGPGEGLHARDIVLDLAARLQD